MSDGTVPGNLPHERTEFAVWAWWEDDRRGELTPRSSRERAEAMADYWNGLPDGPVCTVMVRTVRVGPWVTA